MKKLYRVDCPRFGGTFTEIEFRVGVENYCVYRIDVTVIEKWYLEILMKWWVGSNVTAVKDLKTNIRYELDSNSFWGQTLTNS